MFLVDHGAILNRKSVYGLYDEFGQYQREAY